MAEESRDATTTAPRRIDISGLPAAQRLGYWVEQVWAATARADCEVSEPARLLGRLEHLDAAGLSFNTLQVSAQAFRRRPPHIRRDVEEVFALVWVRRGAAQVEYGEQRQALGEGGVFLNSGVEPGVMALAEGSELMITVVPAALMEAQAGHAHRRGVRAFSPGSPEAGLLAAHLHAFWQQAAGMKAHAALSLRASLLSTLAYAASAPGSLPASDPRLSEYHRTRARQFIERHLHEPGLDVARIAAGVGLSQAHLQRLFAHAGSRLMRELWQRRLARAQSLLRQALPLTHGMVAQIAWRCGFESAAHFSRRFRAHTGMSPRDWAHRGG